MKNILLFAMLFSLSGCTDFDPEPIGKFDMVFNQLNSKFERVYLMDAVQLKNKDIIVGGYVELKEDKGFDVLLVRLNNWGVVQDLLQFDTQADEEITSIAMDVDENIYLAGRRQDNNRTIHGIICKATTKNGLQKSWNKIYEWLPSRLSYKIVGNSNNNLMIFRSAVSGDVAFSGNAGTFLLDTSGTNKRCEKKFGYYDMLGYANFQDKFLFGGTAYDLPNMPKKPDASVVTFLNASTCQMNHKINFNFTTQHEFNHIAALSLGQEGNIYAILNKIDTIKTNGDQFFFQPYFVQLQFDTSLLIMNANRAKTKLAIDTSQKQATCTNMIAGRNNTFIFAVNYKSGESYHTVIEKREATYPEQRGWEPLSFNLVHTKKLVSLANNKTLIICGNNINGFNRLIRINAKGQIE